MQDVASCICTKYQLNSVSCPDFPTFFGALLGMGGYRSTGLGLKCRVPSLVSGCSSAPYCHAMSNPLQVFSDQARPRVCA